MAPSYDTVGVLARSGKVLEQVAQVLAGPPWEPEGGCCRPSGFADDLFRSADQKILDGLAPGLARLSGHWGKEKTTLAKITAPHVTGPWLFEQLGFLLSAEIWNTFGAWVSLEQPKLRHGHCGESKVLCQRCGPEGDPGTGSVRQKPFRTGSTNSSAEGGFSAFPPPWIWLPGLDDLGPEFFAGEYIPRAMGVNAVSSLSGAPQVTIPASAAGQVPAGPLLYGRTGAGSGPLSGFAVRYMSAVLARLAGTRPA